VINKINHIIIFLLLFITCTYGQDVSFSQFYTNPLYLNPAFAGSVGVPRVALQYRNQWHSFKNAFTTYSAAFDTPVDFLQGGIGINVLNDSQGDNLLNSRQVNLAYSVFIRLSRDYRMCGGLQVGFNQNSLNTNELIFADNLDPNYGNHGTTAEIFSDPNFSYVDFSSGILVFSERLFWGLAIHHLTEPQQSFYSGQGNVGKLYRKYTAHFGARLPVFRHGLVRKKYDISPQLIIQEQGSSQQINYGLFATKNGLTAGVWFRQNFGIRYDAVIIMAGFVRNKFQFTYSYDWSVSGLWGDSGGTSEVSLSFLLKEISSRRALPFYSPYKEKFGEQ
jgi:type IX secretion system PorP/SprF family membrane protein